jgi:predicted PhzF superfamily epimerase YddE/YHI9
VETFVARAFTSFAGAGGNAVRVQLYDEPVPCAAERQIIAASAPEPATVFVAADRHHVDLHNRKLERRFIGHALLGAVEVLRSLGEDVRRLTLPVGDVEFWLGADGMQWLHAPSAWSPNANHRQVSSPAEIDAMTGAPPDEPVQVWAWIDEAVGLVRARQFAPSEGKPEDEACGSGSMVLADKLGRSLTIRHGRESVIRVEPRNDGVDLGGFCTIDHPKRK